nr:hypothetical protein [Tanacetum cinerariifolium]
QHIKRDFDMNITMAPLPERGVYHQPPRIQENIFQEKMNDFLTMMHSFCEKLLQQQQAANIDQPPLQEISPKEMDDLKQHYLDEMLSLSNDLRIKDYHNEKIDIRFRRECEDMIHEFKGKFNGISIEINKRESENTIPLNDIISQETPSIIITTFPPVLPNEDPKDSLIMGNEEINTIPKKESHEFIKSSVEDLIPILSDYVELLLHHDPSIPAMSVASILEGFIDEPPLKENDDLFYLEPKNDEWKKILYDAPILMTEDKVFDPEIHHKFFSPTYVSLPFTDCHYLFFTYVVWIFLPIIVYPVVSPFLISSGR